MLDDEKTTAAAFDAGREAFRDDRNAGDWMPRWIDSDELHAAFLEGWRSVPERDGVHLREMGLQAHAQELARGVEDDDDTLDSFDDDGDDDTDGGGW